VPRFTELWVFVASEPDDPDDEGVPAFLSRNEWFPLIAADRARLDSLRPLAESMVEKTGKQIRLMHATNFEEVEVIGGQEST